MRTCPTTPRDSASRPKKPGNTPSLLDKEAWLKVAGEWIKLAEAVEKRGL
jgi:hypothetical protein